MFTVDEMNFMFQLLDQANPRGLAFKRLQVSCMAKLESNLKAAEGLTTDKLKPQSKPKEKEA